MKDVAIIGAGRLGTSLANALSKKGYMIKALSCRTLQSAEESRQIIGQGQALTDNIQAANAATMVILCLPDEEILKVSESLALSSLAWTNKLVLHCSGLLSSEALRPLQKKGALTASVHPVQSFTHKRTSPEHFRDIYFSLEGESEALALARNVIHKLGSRSFIIQPKDKALYHAACSTASNFLVVLLDMACSLLRSTGLREEEAFQILLPLVKGTLHNVKKFNIRSSLTGPVIRGDRETVQQHLEALKKNPLYHETYRHLASQALDMAKKEKKLSPQKIKSLKALLEEK
jgi:predicted short-subunit dehydrogenase-like oxidoreductase (DUF2520 family)